MRNRKNLLLLSLFLLLSLSACSKKSDITESTANFGEVGTESVKETDYSVSDPNFELPTRSEKEIESER